MTTVRRSMTLVIGSEDSRELEALVMNGGNNKVPLSRSSSKTEVNPAIDSRDGSSKSKTSSDKSSSNDSRNNSDGNANNGVEELSNLEDYKNARAKLAFFKQQKSGRMENASRKSPGTPSRRRRKRHSNAEQVRKQLEEILGTDSNTDGEGAVSDHQRTSKRDSKKGERSSGSRSGTPSRRLSKSHTLADFISHPESDARQNRRSSKSTTKTIGSSSTATTKIHSNKSSKHRYSVSELVQNSNWAEGVTKSSEPNLRRPARIRRASTDGSLQKQNSSGSVGNRNHQWVEGTDTPNSSADSHRTSTPKSPKSERQTRSRMARRRSNGDVNTRSLSHSGGTRRPRRRYRHSSSASTGSGSTPSPHHSRSPHSTRSRARRAHTPKKYPAEPTSPSDPVVMTPYNVLQDPKYKKSSASYSDLVMIAADSNKSPMDSLRKILKQEKELTASGKGSNNGGTGGVVRERSKSAGRTRRKSQVTQSLLKIPFSDGEPDTESIEKQSNAEGENNKGVLGVQGFGKSVAKTMKKQAKNTKRRISRQITNAKAATTSRSTPTTHMLLDSTAESNVLSYDTDESDNSFSSKKDNDDGGHDSPLPLKAPSGHRGFGGESHPIPQFRVPKRNGNFTVGVQRVSLSNEDDEKLNGKLALRAPSGHDKNHSPVPLKPPSGQVNPMALRAPSGHRGWSEDKREANFEGSHSNSTEDMERSMRINPEEEKDMKKPRKKRGSKLNRIMMRPRKSETKSTMNSYEQLNCSVGSGLFLNGISDNAPMLPPVYGNNDNDDSSIEFTVNKPAEPIQFVFDSSLSGRDNNSISFHKPMNGSFENEDTSVTQKTDPSTTTSNRPITCKQIYPSIDRDSSVSTFATSGTRSKNTSEKSYSKIQNNSTHKVPKLIVSTDECHHSSQLTINIPEDEEVQIHQVANEKRGVKNMISLFEPLKDDEASAEADIKATSLNSESAFYKTRSKENGDESLSQSQIMPRNNSTGSDVRKIPQVRTHEKSVDEDTTTEQEIFDLLKKESRRIRNETKDRRESSRERAGRRKTERKLRQKRRQGIVDMDVITVNSDPLEISEISNPPYNSTTDRKKSTKPLRSSMSKSDSRGKLKSGEGRKERRTSSRKRASREGSIAASAKQAVDAAISER